MCRDTFTNTMAPVLRTTLQTLLAKAEVGRGFRVMNTAVITTRSPCTMSRGLLERHAHPTSLCTTLLTNCSLYTQADTKLQLHVRLYIYGTGRQGAPAPFLAISDAPQSVNQQRKKGQHYKLLFVARAGGYIYIYVYIFGDTTT